MERAIKKDSFGDIACNNIVIYSINPYNIGKNIELEYMIDWKNIKPKYYRYKDDNTILEIWHNNLGIILNGKLKDFISNIWSQELREEITYERAMKILEKENKISYNNKDLFLKNEDKEIGIDYGKNDLVDAMSYSFLCANKKLKHNNNGGATDYYALPEGANTLQDLIEHRNMNGSIKDIFKACYRLGIKTEDELRDLNKMAYYSLREIGRITGRKDYVSIAEELIGSQAIEEKNDCAKEYSGNSMI